VRLDHIFFPDGLQTVGYNNLVCRTRSSDRVEHAAHAAFVVVWRNYRLQDIQLKVFDKIAWDDPPSRPRRRSGGQVG
jgi:hypothetical protein